MYKNTTRKCNKYCRTINNKHKYTLKNYIAEFKNWNLY